MNNKYFFFALCIFTLAFAPACKKKHACYKKNNANTMIDTTNIVTKTNNHDSVTKF